MVAYRILTAFVDLTLFIQFHHEFSPVGGLETTMRVVVNGTGSRLVDVDDVVTVHAKGVEKHFGNSPGHVFYSTKNKHHGGPFTYKVGSNKLPVGWDVGCRGMRLGEKREFDIPWWEVRSISREPGLRRGTTDVLLPLAHEMGLWCMGCACGHVGWLCCHVIAAFDRGGARTESLAGVFGRMRKCCSRSKFLPSAPKQKRGKRWTMASSDSDVKLHNRHKAAVGVASFRNIHKKNLLFLRLPHSLNDGWWRAVSCGRLSPSHDHN